MMYRRGIILLSLVLGLFAIAQAKVTIKEATRVVGGLIGDIRAYKVESRVSQGADDLFPRFRRFPTSERILSILFLLLPHP